MRHTFELGRLVVVPNRQGMGLGTRLLKEAKAAFSNIREMRLFTGENSISNIRLYKRCRYTETERTPAGSYRLVHFVKPLVQHSRR